MTRINTDRSILLVDCANVFIRSWAAYPTMSSHGYQMGGCIGFMKTLQRLMTEFEPSAVMLAWEGGGSQRRRSLFPEYKLGRKAEKLNRFYEDDIPDSEENKKHQLVTLITMMKCVPAHHLYVSDCEGDDVISYVSKTKYPSSKKIIVSSDKDFYQLLDENTTVYSLHKKTFVTKENVLEEFRVSSRNFAIAKALCGDPSDNIPGVKGLGFKTVAKLYPFLGSDEDVLLSDVFSYAASHVEESRVHKRVLEARDAIERNWKLVYLGHSTLSAHQASVVDNLIGTYKPSKDKVKFTSLLVKEGVNNFDVDAFFYSFNCTHVES